MGKLEETVFCDGCGVEILLSPVVKNNLEYCCEDCAEGYECKCAKRIEPDAFGRLERGSSEIR